MPESKGRTDPPQDKEALLRFAAGSRAYCPSCRQKLEWENTVVANIWRPAPGADRLPAANLILCSDCFAARRARLERCCQDTGLEMKVEQR